MSKTLLSKVKIICRESQHNGEVVDVLLSKNNTILEIAKAGSLTDEGRIINAEGMLLSKGWFDLSASFNDPGNEHIEDLQSGSQAALNGGFAGVLLNPDTAPAVDQKSTARYILNQAAALPLRIELYGALSNNLEGKELAEIYDLGQSGVKCFSNGRKALDNPGLLKLALQYTKSAGGKVFSFPHSQLFAPGGMVNEGEVSTACGLKGIPPEAEIMQVNRDLHVAKYCDSPIHFSCITTAGSLELIKKFRAEGLQVTCDAAYFNLAFNDAILIGFNSNFKVNPPLRSEKDRQALIKGVNEGSIDAICTNHHPQNVELKECEFDVAALGAATIETIYPVFMENLAASIDFDVFVQALTDGPAKILGEKVTAIEEGVKTSLTLVNPNESYTLDDTFFKSKSRNTPLLNKKVKGKVVEVFT